MELQVGFGSRVVNGKNISAIESERNSVLLEIDGADVVMHQNQRIFISDSKTSGKGTFLTLLKVQRGVAIFEARKTRELLRRKVVRKKLRKTRNAMRMDHLAYQHSVE